MENNVRVHNTDNILKNVLVEVRNGAEWVDIGDCVTGVHWGGNVGDISAVKLELIPAEFYTEGVISHETLEVFAAALRANGWLVEPPDAAEDA